MFYTHRCFIIQLLMLTNTIYVLLYYGVIRHILIVFLFLFSPTSRWPHEWPKHIGDHCAIKLHP